LINKQEADTKWHYFATYLDEFEQRKILEKPADFKASYKDPDEFCCLFVVDIGFTNFLFIPYPDDL
jgi:hypothetical protein